MFLQVWGLEFSSLPGLERIPFSGMNMAWCGYELYGVMVNFQLIVNYCAADHLRLLLAEGSLGSVRL